MPVGPVDELVKVVAPLTLAAVFIAAIGFVVAHIPDQPPSPPPTVNSEHIGIHVNNHCSDIKP